MWLLCLLQSCAALTLVRHRAALHRAPMATPKALPAWRDPSALRHRVQARATARQPTMVFGLSRVFGWLKTSDFMWTGVLVFFLLKRLKQVAEDPFLPRGTRRGFDRFLQQFPDARREGAVRVRL